MAGWALKQMLGMGLLASRVLVRADDGSLLRDKRAILEGWSQHFHELLNTGRDIEPDTL